MLSARIKRTPTKVAAFATLLLITLLSLSAVALAQEAPLVEVLRPVESFWSSFFSTQATVPLNMFVVYDTSSCRTLYEGKCDVEAKVMFDCYADSAGACHCYTKTEAGKCGVSGGTCSDSDGGNNVLIKGTATAGAQSITDSCVSSSTIREAFCVSGTVSWTAATKDYYCPASQTCQDGACKTAPTSAMCRDTDGGINPQQRGTVIWTGLSASGQAYSDTCNSDTQIKEYYCDGDDVVGVARNCGSNERCTRDVGKPEASCVPVTGCTDSDGNNIYSKGSVTWNLQTVTDTCNADTRVTEYSCSGGVRTQTDTPCPSGYKCETGACIIGTLPPPKFPLPGAGDGTGSTGLSCVDDTYCKPELTCAGTAEQKAQALGTCTIRSDGGGDGGTGGTGGTGGNGGTEVCCQRNIATAEGLYYTAANAESCNQRGVGGILGKDPVVEMAKCTSTSGTVCASDEVKQADGTCKKSTPSDTFKVPLGSIPSLDDEITEASAASILKSLCLDDDQCESKECDGSRTTLEYIDDVVNDRAEAYDSSLGEIFNFGFEKPKTGQEVVTEGQEWKKDTLITGVCIEKSEKFNFEKFFKDNQTMIFVGIGAILLLMFLPSILPRRS